MGAWVEHKPQALSKLEKALEQSWGSTSILLFLLMLHLPCRGSIPALVVEGMEAMAVHGGGRAAEACSCWRRCHSLFCHQNWWLFGCSSWMLAEKKKVKSPPTAANLQPLFLWNCHWRCRAWGAQYCPIMPLFTKQILSSCTLILQTDTMLYHVLYFAIHRECSSEFKYVLSVQ